MWKRWHASKRAKRQAQKHVFVRDQTGRQVGTVVETDGMRTAYDTFGRKIGTFDGTATLSPRGAMLSQEDVLEKLLLSERGWPARHSRRM